MTREQKAKEFLKEIIKILPLDKIQLPGFLSSMLGGLSPTDFLIRLIDALTPDAVEHILEVARKLAEVE